MKIYVKQIPPEQQESPLFLFEEDFPQNIILTGNRQYREHTTPAYNRLIDHWEEVAQEIEAVKAGNGWYKNATAAILDLLYPEHKARYTTKEIHRWKTILANMTVCQRNEEWLYICEALGLMTGEFWDITTIHGSNQGDFQEVYYPVSDWSKEALKEFEIEYFNTGSEWMIHDGDKAPDGPDDISGFCVYCHAWDTEGIKKELAAAADVAPENLVLYEFNHYSQVAVYREAEGA